MNFREFIKREYDRRKRNNPSYSMRAFARDLECPASRLSEIISGRAGMSATRAKTFSSKLGLDKEAKKLFLLSVKECHGKSPAIRQSASAKLRSLTTPAKMSLDKFCVISDWYYLAILELAKLHGDQLTKELICSELSFTKEQSEEILEKLKKLELLQKVERQYVVTRAKNQIGEDIPSTAVKNFHRQILNKAACALDDQPIDGREYSANYFSIKEENLPKLKLELRRLRNKFVEEHEDDEPDSVYCLSMQLFKLIGR